MVGDRAGRILAGRYVLEEELGRGGMGSVWRAADRRLDRVVAIKLMVKRFGDDPIAMARFEREARAVARLHSPHIVELHDYGVEDGTAFMVMEMLRGQDLAKRLKQTRSFALPVAADVVAQVAKALTTAHAANVVHRDLKPGNIFLVRDQDGDEHIKVFDFGLASAFSPQRDGPRKLTRQGDIMGTPRYMSPEQMRGQPSDPRDDVWALAVIAYRMVCGVHAFRGSNIALLSKQVLYDTAPPPSEHLTSLSADMDALFATALARDREERFTSARAFAQALARIVKTEAELDDDALDSTTRSVSSQEIETVPEPSLRTVETVSMTEDSTATVPLPRELVDEDLPSATGPLGMAVEDPSPRAKPRWWLAAMLALGAVGGSVAVMLSWRTTPPAIAPSPAAHGEKPSPAVTAPPPASATATTTAAAEKPPLAPSASSPPKRTPPETSRSPPPRAPVPASKPKPEDLFDGVF